MSREAFDKLRERMMTIGDLHGAGALLEWDQRTMMPPRGAAVRAERLGTLGKIAHEMLISEETGELLAQAESYAGALSNHSDDAALARLVRRRYDKARKIPVELSTARVRAATLGYAAWVRARSENDYSLFRPALETNLDLLRQEVDILREGLPAGGEDYDVLLDDYEPKLTAAEVRTVFDQLKAGTLPLVERVREHADTSSVVAGRSGSASSLTCERRSPDNSMRTMRMATIARSTRCSRRSSGFRQMN